MKVDEEPQTADSMTRPALPDTAAQPRVVQEMQGRVALLKMQYRPHNLFDLHSLFFAAPAAALIGDVG